MIKKSLKTWVVAYNIAHRLSSIQGGYPQVVNNVRSLCLKEMALKDRVIDMCCKSDCDINRKVRMSQCKIPNSICKDIRLVCQDRFKEAATNQPPKHYWVTQKKSRKGSHRGRRREVRKIKRHWFRCRFCVIQKNQLIIKLYKSQDNICQKHHRHVYLYDE